MDIASGARYHNAYSSFATGANEFAYDGHEESNAVDNPLYELTRSNTVRTLGDDEQEEVELGVHKAEILSQLWSQHGLHVAYIGLFCLAFTTSLSGQVAALLTPFATSEFHAHSLLATVSVVQGILFAVVKTPMAKIANAFGRLEAFVLSLVLISVGYLQMALAGGVIAYASAQLFSASGTTGLLILQQIFVADTTDLLNRAFFSVLPDVPYLFTVWIAPNIANVVTEKFTWRKGYGIWVALIPVAASPLVYTLFKSQREGRRLGLIPKYTWAGRSVMQILSSVSSALDVLGLLLFTAACSMILIPLTLSSTMESQWHDARIPGLLLGGTALFVLFVLWELRLASAVEADPHNATLPRPLLSLHVLKNKTVLSGCGVIFFYDMVYNIVQPYFFSYLMVTRDISTDGAGQVVQLFSFAATMSGLLVSYLIKRSSRYKRWLLIGIPVYQLGIMSMHFTRGPSIRLTWVVLSQVLTGIGGGMLSLPTQLGVQASCGHADVALATAMFLTVFSLGSAVGASISGAIWTSLLPVKLRQYVLPEMLDLVPQIYADFSYARHTFPDLMSPERQSIVAAYKDVMAVLLWVGIGTSIPSFIGALFMTEYDLAELSRIAMAHAPGGSGYNYNPVGPKDSDDEGDEEEAMGATTLTADGDNINADADDTGAVLIGSHRDRTAAGDRIVLQPQGAEEALALDAGVGATLGRV
ncbi:major facilitator superfamily domain-containing protein [Limtongia smithiae]|uniref:major facilitator superfamily domain-containing protein n=1 Tax=Limtongia smithiae TaxID=1125753 RepID=UPI0034CF556A